MSNDAKLMTGIILLIIPTIAFGGYFLLQLRTNKLQLNLTPFQKNLMKSGHSHAGVLSTLALVLQPFLDLLTFDSSIIWFLRIGFILSAILISGGFFGAAGFAKDDKPGKLIGLVYFGSILLCICLIFSGIGFLL